MADAPRLPSGIQLQAGESIIHTARDWGVSTNPLVLTNRRLICPADSVGRAVAVIPLSDIQDVRLRKPFLGYNTVVIERKTEPPAQFPAHINGERIRADIAAAMQAADEAATPKLSVVDSEPAAGDRYERLRQIGKLRDQGVLTEAEFEEEKARILKEP